MNINLTTGISMFILAILVVLDGATGIDLLDAIINYVDTAANK